VVDNIKIDLGILNWGSMDWINLAEDKDQRRALVNTTMNLRIHKNVGKFLSN
jgi:hypothetical protein